MITNVGLAQLRQWMPGPLEIGSPFFRDAVALIVASGAEEEMRWVTTWRVVAAVQHGAVILNWSTRDLPRDPMR
jgi:hypothetical protein